MTEGKKRVTVSSGRTWEMNETLHTSEELKQWQALPLNIKIRMTKARIRDWVNAYGEDGVYVSFSGGKDSTVLLHLVREDYPGVVGCFVDTGLEYPEIRQFVRGFDNIEWLKPEMNFKKVIEQYGYPVVSKEVSHSIHDIRTYASNHNVDVKETHLYKRSYVSDSEYCQRYPHHSKARYAYLLDSPFKISHKCCDVMKKHPSIAYEKRTGRKPFIATMASESRLRKMHWMKEGCNAFDAPRPTSKPMSFWTENDVLEYIYKNNIEIASVYGEVIRDGETDGQMNLFDYIDSDMDYAKYKTTGLKRTGCMFCGYGCLSKGWKNCKLMKTTHPKQYEYILRPRSQGGLGFKEVYDWINEYGNAHIQY